MKHRICIVEIFSDLKGYRSRIKLETEKFDNIGFTKESLHEFMIKFILDSNEWYNVTSDKIFSK